MSSKDWKSFVQAPEPQSASVPVLGLFDPDGLSFYRGDEDLQHRRSALSGRLSDRLDGLVDELSA